MKDIPGYEGLYAVTTDGRVWSYSKKDYLKTQLSYNGYVWLKLSLNGKSKTKRVHRLVAATYIPNPQAKPCVNHLDGNKKNNDLSNLEWVTNQENTDHAKANNLFNVARGEKAGPSKLRDKDVIAIRLKHKQGRSVGSLAWEYNLVHNGIKGIITGRTWKHLPI